MDVLNPIPAYGFTVIRSGGVTALRLRKVLFQDAAEFRGHSLDASFGTVNLDAPVKTLGDVEREPDKRLAGRFVRAFRGFLATYPIGRGGWRTSGLRLGGNPDFLGHG
jgi:hypothetical protein